MMSNPDKRFMYILNGVQFLKTAILGTRISIFFADTFTELGYFGTEECRCYGL